jgi:hypothetical protein
LVLTVPLSQHRDSRGEGPTAAASALSAVTDVTKSVLRDGPITMYHHGGDLVLELL